MSIHKRVKAERNLYRQIWKLSSVAFKAFANKRLKLALRRRSSEQGFAIPIAIGLGLIMILIATMMIMRSQGDQVTASAQKGAAQSLALTEGGVTRSLSTVNQYTNGSLLILNYDSINPATNKTYLGPDGILNNGDEETTAVNQWSSPPTSVACSSSRSLPIGLLSSNISSGSYQIKAYRYQNPDGNQNSGDEIGTLLVEGNQESAASRVQVSMQIVSNPSNGSFAGLYASNTIDLGNNDVMKVAGAGNTGSSANVICRNCTVPARECPEGVPTLAGLADAVGMGSNSVIDGTIFIGDPQLPALPIAPTNACSSTSGANCSIDLRSISSATTLPRVTDTTNRTTWGIASSEPYHYVISSITLRGSDVITINTSSAPVYLYLSGNVSLSGGGGIAHTGSPERLRLYGKPADANDSNDQSITISGGSSTTNMFIYAPDATMGINGGSSDPDIQGAVWTKTWNGSSSNNAEIRVPDNMPTLLGGYFSNVGRQVYRSVNLSRWQRQPIDN